jgi:Flp pilus assembly protein TadG
MNTRDSKNSADCRRGVAAAEFAVCLPVIVLLVLGMIECCTMIFLKDSLTVAAYEGARTALVQDAEGNDVRRIAQEMLTQRRVRRGTIVIEPIDFERAAVGEYITVTVAAPADANAVIPGSFFRGRTLTSSVTMMKEL